MSLDNESLAALRGIAGAEAGLPVSFHHRIKGEGLVELRADARSLARDLGFTSPTVNGRDERGRFSSASEAMNAEIRRRAGYPLTSAREPAAGDLGVGRGGAALPRPPQPVDMSSLIRGAAAARRGVAHIYTEQLAQEGPP
jgi:hypothetical protein